MNERFQTFAASLAVIVSAVALGFSAQTSFVPIMIVIIMFFHLVWGLTIPTKPHTVISFLMALPFALWFKFYPESVPGYGTGTGNVMRLLPILGFYILCLDVHQILCYRHGGNLHLSLGTAVFAFALAGAAQNNMFYLPLACILIGVVLWELRRNLNFKSPVGMNIRRRFPVSQAASFIAVLMVAVGFQVLLIDQLPTMGAWLVNNVTNTTGTGVSAGYTHSTTVQLGSVPEIWNTTQDDSIVLRYWSTKAPEYLRGSVYINYEHNGWRSIPEEKPIPSTSDHYGRHVFQLGGRTTEKVVGSVYPEREFASNFFLPPGTSQIATFESQVLASDAWTARPAPNSVATRGGYDVYEAIDHMLPPTEGDKYVSPFLQNDLNRIGTHIFGAASTDAEKIKRLNEYFANNFKYKIGIELKQRRMDPVIEFLTLIKEGHCEYFASAGVLLLRAAGIPARYVTGFRCDERGLTGDMWISRRRDAHAWVEAYLPDKGWITVDPTPATFRPDKTKHSVGRSMAEWVGATVSSILQFFIYGGIGGVMSASYEFLVNTLAAVPKEGYAVLIFLGLLFLFRQQIRNLIYGKKTLGPVISQRAKDLQRRLIQTQRALKRHGLIQSPHTTVSDFIEQLRHHAVPEPLKSEAIQTLQEYDNQRFAPEESLATDESTNPAAAPRPLQTIER